MREKKRPYVLEPSPWKNKVLFRFLCVRTLQFAVANRKTNSRSIFRVFRALWPGVSSGQHETRTRCTFFPSYVSFSVDVELRELFNFLEWLKKKRFETGVNDTSKGAFLGSPTWVLSFSLRVCCLGIFAASPAGPATLTSGGATVGRMNCAYLSVLLFGWFVTWSALYESVPLFVLCTPSLFSPNLLAFEISVS